MGFNPNQHRPTREQSEFGEDLPPGVYLLGSTWLQCPTARSWKMRFQSIMGPLKGGSCFVLQGRDTSKEGTANRLYYFAQSAGFGPDTDLDTDGNGILTEETIRDHMLGCVIKAKVTRKKRMYEGRETYDYDFAMFHPRGEWSAAELAAAKAWEKQFAENQAAERGGGGSWGGGRSSGGGGFDESAPMPSGDEWGNDGWGG